MGAWSWLKRITPHFGAYSQWDDYWFTPVGSTDWYNLGLTTETDAGVNVNPRTVLQSSPVWAAVRLLSESIAMMPLIMYRRLPNGGKERAYEHPLFSLLHDSPNPLQSAFEFKRVLMVHALLWGNAYAKIVPGPRGPVDQLVPLYPSGVRVESLDDGGIRYLVRERDGREQVYNDEDIFHLRGLTIDGINGLSLMRYARESIGLALAAKSYTARSFSQNARPGGIIKVKGRLSPDAKKRLREEWEAAHSGLTNAHGTAVLEDDADWTQTGMTNEDAQLLQLLDWTVPDIARYFNVPLHMIQEVSKTTTWGSGIEQLAIAFVTFSLMPWVRNWEDRISNDLIVANRLYFAEFLIDILLRGSTKERYEAYQIAAGGQAPWMSRNEVRSLENLNPMPGLDNVVLPLNMGGGQPIPTGALSPNGHDHIDELLALIGGKHADADAG